MTPKHSRTRPPTRKHRNVGQSVPQAENRPEVDEVSVEIEPEGPEVIRARLDKIAALLGGQEPMPAEEAARALGRIHGTKTAGELVADRAEALTQIQVAEATLQSLAMPALPVVVPAPVVPVRRRDKKRADAEPQRLRQVARLAVTATVNLRQAEVALDRLPHPPPEVIAAVEGAQSEADAARSQLEPARRRTVGALISASGMVIVISTVGWPASVYLVPTAMVLMVTADMRVAGVTAKQTRARLAERMAAAESRSGTDLDAARNQVAAWQEANARRDDGARRHQEAWAAWEQIAPGRDPGTVEDLIGGDGPAPAPVAPETAVPPAPDPVSERARLMAEQLIEDATRELAMIAEAESELRLRLRAERSLAWHEARAALDSAG